MPVNEVSQLINAIDKNKTEFNSLPFISKKLRKLVEIPEPEKQLADKLEQTKNEIKNELQQTKDEFRNQLNQTKDELKIEFKKELTELKQTNEEQIQQMKKIQELLDSFIKNHNN